MTNVANLIPSNKSFMFEYEWLIKTCSAICQKWNVRFVINEYQTAFVF